MEKEKTTNLLDNAPKNTEIFNSLVVTKSKLEDINYKNVMVSVSGGSDSDIILDMCYRCDKNKKAKYVFFDTGLEYQATKEHLEYLEKKYDIEIVREKPIKPIPLSCKEHGQPFLSKQVSEYIQRLQRHNFKWEDRPFEELYKEYPNCKIALMWWCNERGENSAFNINRNKYLKEFMLENPPTFNISNKCCTYAKKNNSKRYEKKNKIDLKVVGVRKSEGGARAKSYKNCFSQREDGLDDYRPIFWYKDETKKIYEEYFNIKHSRCYEEYGLKRTGWQAASYSGDIIRK